ncbi:MAG: acyltransferase family protein, partial [Solirubrobacteraceae bacterium]
MPERPAPPSAPAAARDVAARPRLPYAPGLDGLRALAVAAVVLYHGGVGWASGGFLGVDVFFVLSGFLITSLLLVERDHSGTIELARFWLRRARRLLPAALTLIGVCLLVTAVFMPSDLAWMRGDSIASALYFNNWHQIIDQRSYFQSFARPSLLQHLWSLSVEEQFYLLWPPLLLLASARLRRRNVIIATALAAIASAVAMGLVYTPGADPSAVYYDTGTRAFELLAGALLAFAWSPARLRADLRRGAAAAIDVA